MHKAGKHASPHCPESRPDPDKGIVGKSTIISDGVELDGRIIPLEYFAVAEDPNIAGPVGRDAVN